VDEAITPTTISPTPSFITQNDQVDKIAFAFIFASLGIVLFLLILVPVSLIIFEFFVVVFLYSCLRPSDWGHLLLSTNLAELVLLSPDRCVID
jgi:hypothetical protein